MYCGTVERVMTIRVTKITDGCPRGGIAIQRELNRASPAVKRHFEQRHVSMPLVRLEIMGRVPDTDGHGGGLSRDGQH